LKPSGDRRATSSGLHLVTPTAQLIEGGVDVEGVPEYHDVDNQPKDAKLVLLALAITLPDLAAAAVTNRASETVAAFTSVQLGENLASICLVVDEAEQMQCLVDAAKFSDGAGQF
jgi:hypothetical protein